MRKFLSAGLVTAMLSLSGLSVDAQQRTSVFEDYAAFDSFVTEMISKRAFGALFQRIGGGDRISLSDVQKITEQSRKSFPADFDHSEVFLEKDLGGGFSQEARAFWTGESYAFVYVMLHARDDGLVVVNFSIHASPAPVLALF